MNSKVAGSPLALLADNASAVLNEVIGGQRSTL